MTLADGRETSHGAPGTADDGHVLEAGAHAVLAARAQAAAAERTHGPAKPISPPPVYAGLFTRAIAFTVDAATVYGPMFWWESWLGLRSRSWASRTRSTRLLFALGGFLFVLWTIGYFAAFWSATGETPGNRLMRIRVRQ